MAKNTRLFRNRRGIRTGVKKYSGEIGIELEKRFFDNAREIMLIYGINIGDLKYFTFDKIE
ncbi:MAG: hypothetical protein UR15_C0015G0004 [Parcubacteria group bacterium GW2011_GWA2_31_28]|nr:MAG: hypothetical protein UR15_C0015G0004 [Parcubacteria group bacterium GW2011_GWA2_31_28]